jgi:hypothetical protein
MPGHSKWSQIKRQEGVTDRRGLAIQAGRQMIARGERPLYRAKWRWEGPAVDVEVWELPGIHLFVPSRAEVAAGARALIARELDVPADSFDVAVEPTATGSPDKATESTG